MRSTAFKRISQITFATTALLFSALVTSAENETVWSLKGFDEPESVLAHPTKPLLYVSNINGHPLGLNGKGYISLVSTDGEVIHHGWSMGMNAPKGMAIHGNHLYVADMQQLHVVDSESGELLKSVTAPNSKMLNDIAVDNDGAVYVSDFLGGKVYQYSGEQLEPWLADERIPHPNGLLISDGRLILASWGKGMKEDFSTEELGALYTVNLDNKKLTLLEGSEHIGNFDGLGINDGTIIVSDWINGNVFTYRNGKAELLINAGKHAADIGVANNKLYVPLMFSKKMDVYPLK